MIKERGITQEILDEIIHYLFDELKYDGDLLELLKTTVEIKQTSDKTGLSPAQIRDENSKLDEKNKRLRAENQQLQKEILQSKSQNEKEQKQLKSLRHSIQEYEHLDNQLSDIGITRSGLLQSGTALKEMSRLGNDPKKILGTLSKIKNLTDHITNLEKEDKILNNKIVGKKIQHKDVISKMAYAKRTLKAAEATSKAVRHVERSGQNPVDIVHLSQLLEQSNLSFDEFADMIKRYGSLI